MTFNMNPFLKIRILTRQTFFALLVLVAIFPLSAAESLMSTAAHRRPVALEIHVPSNQLFVLNQRAATVSILDMEQQMVTGEIAVGGAPSDMERIDKSDLIAIANQANHVISLFTVSQNHLVHVHDIPCCHYPVQLRYDPESSLMYVAGLWSRQLSVAKIDRDAPEKSKLLQILDLPYAPRKMATLADHDKMIVADAYGGTLGIFDIENAAQGQVKLLGLRTFPGHNVRGLEISAKGEMLLIAHQMLNELAHTVRNDVHWGLLMSNDLRWLRLENVIKGGEHLYSGAHMHPLGEAGSATGDPSGMVVTDSGTVVVILGGVGEIAYGKEDDFSLQRLEVGLRPVDVVIDDRSQRIYTANMLGDSISVVDLEAQQSREISMGPQAPWTIVDRGEKLFFSAKLSHDGWMSCHSCHTDGHTNGMLNDNFSDKSFGAPKRVLSLLGKQDTAPFAWNGKAENLQTQIKNSLTLTMQMDEIPSDKQLSELVAFVKTLQAPPSIDQARQQVDVNAIQRGKEVFRKADCRQCHAPPAFTVGGLFDVGLTDSEGNQEFNPPSLRGVGQRVHFFHDNAAKTLTDVFLIHGHPSPESDQVLSPQQVSDLVHYLRSL